MHTPSHSGQWPQSLIVLILACLSASSAFVAPTRTHHVTPSLAGIGSQHRFRAATAPGISSSLSISTSDNVGHDNKNNVPRLAVALEKTTKWIIQNILLRKCSSLAVNIDTTSNSALLQGKFDHLSISARDCIFRFNLLSFKRWDVTGVDLRLGYMPLVLPFLPLLIWRLRTFIWSAVLVVQLSTMFGHLKAGSLRQMFRTVKEKTYDTLRAQPSTINYSLAISKDNIDQSLALRFWLQSILRSLVENSVVGAAAAVGDEMKRQLNQERQRGVPLSPSSNALAPFSSNNNAFGSQSQQQGLTSTLLSATAFNLKDTSFSNGRIILQAEGVIPKDENSSSGKQTLFPFTIRAKLEPTSVGDDGQPLEEGRRRQQKQNYNAISFASPECRLNTGPLTAGSILGKLIPDVLWIPFGVGVAVPLGKRCRIYRAEASDGKGDGNDDGVCRIDGSLAMFTPVKKSMNENSLIVRSSENL